MIMKSVDVESWEEFENQLALLKDERKKTMADGITSPHFLFRGQCDSEWHLQTTLERFREIDISVWDYYHIISKVRPEIESITDNKWVIKSLQDYIKWSEDVGDFWYEYPAYDYMVYLRHHGFPSPLLDWTRSPYIAALFAFSNFTYKTDRVAVYVYQESSKGVKVWSGGEPRFFLEVHT